MLSFDNNVQSINIKYVIGLLDTCLLGIVLEKLFILIFMNKLRFVVISEVISRRVNLNIIIKSTN